MIRGIGVEVWEVKVWPARDPCLCILRNICESIMEPAVKSHQSLHRKRTRTPSPQIYKLGRRLEERDVWNVEDMSTMSTSTRYHTQTA
jgi:hypothetical protein